MSFQLLLPPRLHTLVCSRSKGVMGITSHRRPNSGCVVGLFSKLAHGSPHTNIGTRNDNDVPGVGGARSRGHGMLVGRECPDA